MTAQEKLSPTPERGNEAAMKLVWRVMHNWDFSEADAKNLIGFGCEDMWHRCRIVIAIAAQLDALYRNPDAVFEWLDEPQPILKDATPRGLLASGSMKDLLTLKQYVEYLSGR